MHLFSKPIIIAAVATGLLAGCANTYDPGTRALGGGAIGAGTGALLGGLAGGGNGALTGALIGGAVGAVGGVATTPHPEPQPVYRQAPPPSGPYQY